MVGGIRPSAGVVLPHLPPALLHYTINRRKLQAVRQKICAKKVKMLGGVPSLPPAYPAFTFFSAPYPPDPLPRRGRGRPRLFHARGFAPCIPGAEPRRHLQNLPNRYPAGGLPGWSPAYPAFSLLSCPLSPCPLPRWGRGCPKVYFAGGFAPGTPAFNRLRHSQSLPNRYPAAEIRDLPQKRQEAVPYEQCRQPRRGGTGGDGTIRRKRRRRLRWSSPPGQVEPVPRGFSPLRTPQRQG